LFFFEEPGKIHKAKNIWFIEKAAEVEHHRFGGKGDSNMEGRVVYPHIWSL